MSQISEIQMVNRTMKVYFQSSTINSLRNGVVNSNKGILSSSNKLFENVSENNSKDITTRDYSVYSLKNYPFYHSTKVGEELTQQKQNRYQVASSHGHNGDAPHIKSIEFKHRKYHKKNEHKHGEDFDNKPIYQHILKRNEFKTVSELKEDYRRMVEESKKNAPKFEHRETQEKMKDFSLGVD